MPDRHLTARRVIEKSLAPAAFFLLLGVLIALVLPLYGVALAVASLYALLTNVLYSMVLAHALVEERRSALPLVVIFGKVALLLLVVRLLALLPTGAILLACFGFLTIVSWGAARLSKER